MNSTLALNASSSSVQAFLRNQYLATNPLKTILCLLKNLRDHFFTDLPDPPSPPRSFIKFLCESPRPIFEKWRGSGPPPSPLGYATARLHHFPLRPLCHDIITKRQGWYQKFSNRGAGASDRGAKMTEKWCFRSLFCQISSDENLKFPLTAGLDTCDGGGGGCSSTRNLTPSLKHNFSVSQKRKTMDKSKDLLARVCLFDLEVG